MNKLALRTAAASALAIPAIVLGAGAVSAQPVVVDGPNATPGDFDAGIQAGAGDLLGICMVTAPGFQLVFPGATAATVTGTDPAGVPAGTGQAVSGTCVGLPYFVAPLSGTTTP